GAVLDALVAKNRAAPEMTGRARILAEVGRANPSRIPQRDCSETACVGRRRILGANLHLERLSTRPGPVHDGRGRNGSQLAWLDAVSRVRYGRGVAAPCGYRVDRGRGRVMPVGQR